MTEIEIQQGEAWALIEGIALAQRKLIRYFLLAIALNLLNGALVILLPSLGASPNLIVVVFVSILIGLNILIGYMSFGLAKALGSRVPLLWGIGVAIPNLVGVIVLLIILSRANAELKAAGLKVGLMGAQVSEQPPPDWTMYVPKGHRRKR